MKKITTIAGQNLYDIATQHYGGREGVVWLLQDNSFLSLENDLESGLEISIRENEKVNRTIANYFITQNITINTA